MYLCSYFESNDIEDLQICNSKLRGHSIMYIIYLAAMYINMQNGMHLPRDVYIHNYISRWMHGIYP